MGRLLYVASVELIDYAAVRGIVLEETEATQLVNLAQDYIDNAYTWKGVPVFTDSAFPRKGLLHFSRTEVPPVIKNATLYIALLLKSGTPIQAGNTATPVLKKESIGASKIEREFAVDYKSSQVQDYVLFPHLTRQFAVQELLMGMANTVNLIGCRG